MQMMNVTPATKTAIILFGHGSRDALWHLPIQAVAERVRIASPNTAVTCAYLELTEPSLLDAAAQLVGVGISNITILPMFLGVGRHAREDLPALITELQQNHPHVTFHVQPAVGENPAVLDLLAEIALSSHSI
jgi:sirohydrochlorin cobaltochelatase